MLQKSVFSFPKDPREVKQVFKTRGGKTVELSPITRGTVSNTKINVIV